MSKKKVRKKDNPIVRMNRLAIAAFRDMAVVMPIGASEGVELRDVFGRRWQATQYHWHCVEKIKHSWWIALALETPSCVHVHTYEVVLRNENGDQLDSNHCHHAELIDHIKDAHLEMLKEFESVIGVTATGYGWCASIKEITPEEAEGYLRVGL